METQEYVRYAKYATGVCAVLFLLGTVGELVGHSVFGELPAPFASAFIYMLAVGLGGFFISLMSMAVIPLALE
jgi:hypothetical protein